MQKIKIERYKHLNRHWYVCGKPLKFAPIMRVRKRDRRNPPEIMTGFNLYLDLFQTYFMLHSIFVNKIITFVSQLHTR